jgi:hypothetical protein
LTPDNSTSPQELKLSTQLLRPSYGISFAVAASVVFLCASTKLWTSFHLSSLLYILLALGITMPIFLILERRWSRTIKVTSNNFIGMSTDDTGSIIASCVYAWLLFLTLPGLLAFVLTFDQHALQLSFWRNSLLFGSISLLLGHIKVLYDATLMHRSMRLSPRVGYRTFKERYRFLMAEDFSADKLIGKSNEELQHLITIGLLSQNNERADIVSQYLLSKVEVELPDRD